MEPIRPLPKPETRRRRPGRNNRNRRHVPRRHARQQHRRTPITRNPPLRPGHRTTRRGHHTRIHQPKQRTHHAASIRTTARRPAPRRMRRRQIRAGMAAHHRARRHRTRGRTAPPRGSHPPHPKPTNQPHVSAGARGGAPHALTKDKRTATPRPQDTAHTTAPKPRALAAKQTPPSRHNQPTNQPTTPPHM